MNPNRFATANGYATGTCPTSGKYSYETRKQARRARRRAHPGDHLQPYQCPDCGWFHLGHIPGPVATGHWDKDDWLDSTR